MTDAQEPFEVQLSSQLCRAFAVRPDGDNRWAVRSPFLFDDGDVLPVFVVSDGNGAWRLTDDGMVLSHLFFDDFSSTDRRLARLVEIIERHGAELQSGNSIVTTAGLMPDAYDVGDFLQLISQLQGVALTFSNDRDSTRFVTTVRSSVEARLSTPDFEANWSPPELRERTKAKYRADLRIGTATPGRDVVLFAASTSDKANVSALSVGHFRKMRRELIPLLAYDPERVPSEAVYRFQDEVEDDRSVVAVAPQAVDILVAELERRGVGISASQRP